MDDRERRFGAMMIELADVRTDRTSEAAYSARVADLLAALLAPAEVNLMVADDAGQLSVTAASSERALRLGRLAEKHGGPCGLCYLSGAPAGGRHSTFWGDRWPEFAAACGDAGIEAVSALPMQRHELTIGAVCVLSPDAEPEPADADLAGMIAEAATVGILQIRETKSGEVRAEQLQRALDSRVVIEQAKGAVAVRIGTSPATAFELLRSYARRHNRKLFEVATAAVSGELTAQDLTEVSQVRSAARRKRYSL